MVYLMENPILFKAILTDKAGKRYDRNTKWDKH